MNRRQTLLVGVIWTFSLGVSMAQPSGAAFGTCAYWQDHRPKTSTDVGAQFYRLGISHGFVFGIVSNLPREQYADVKWRDLDDTHRRGLSEVLRRPAILVDAFDQKCGDYRNQGIILSRIGLMILLEIGGVSAQGIEKALEVMRSGGDNEAALDALILAK